MRTEKELTGLKKDELVVIAKEYDLPSSGTKEEIAKRIVIHQMERYEQETERLEGVLYHNPEEGEGLLVTSQAMNDDNTKPNSIVAGGNDPTASETNPRAANGEESVSNHVVFKELPSRTFVAGGYEFKPYLATLAVVFIMMFGYGFQDYYGSNFSYPGDDKATVDCIRVSYYEDGNGNDSGYDPTSQANLDCAERLNISPNWWQEDMDAWVQSLLNSATSDGNHSGFVWTQPGIDTMAYLGATTFNTNMSVFGDPLAGDEFTEQHLAIWNGFGATFPGGGNDSIESLLQGGNSPFSIYMPAGIVDHRPTGYLWTQSGIDTMAYLGATTFNTNMSVFGDPVAGDVFTEQHLAVWNGFGGMFPGGGNDSIADLLPGGASPFAVYMPTGIVEDAPTGYLWSHPGVPTMSNLGSSTFGANMSVYGDPVPGDVFTEAHLAVWNGFTLALGGGNDSIASLLPGGNSPFSIYMPSGIVIMQVEWDNQTPSASNVTLSVNNSTTPSVYSLNYVFYDGQNGTDNSTVEWFVNGTYVANTTTYTANLANGSTIMCIVTPYDDMYWGVPVESNTLLIAVENQS
ncbi:MAG: hypothetical protein HOI79_01520 [Euryarchaeota archaeon]|nr:hypothetical protein [Euryarchaeota archaeon]